MSSALPMGNGHERLRLWDNQWCLMWDSATAPTPAYRHIGTWVNATIDYSNGTRWAGRLYRTPLGIQREKYPDREYLNRILTWPTLDDLGLIP